MVPQLYMDWLEAHKPVVQQELGRHHQPQLQHHLGDPTAMGNEHMMATENPEDPAAGDYRDDLQQQFNALSLD